MKAKWFLKACLLCFVFFCLIGCVAAKQQTKAHLSPIEIYGQPLSRPDVEKIAAKIKPLYGEFSEENARRVLDILISYHTNPDVKALGKMVAEKKIVFIYNRLGIVAGFSLWPAKAVPGKYRLLEKRPFYPVLTVNPVLMFSQDENDILVVMLSLDHEALHWRQWLAAGTEGQRLYKALYDRSINKIKALPPRSCRYLWEIEKEAYGRTCRLFHAWQMEMTEDFDVCRYQNEQELALKILNTTFIKGYYSFLTECVPEWEKEAEKYK
jgi:hypothetical protein